VSTTTRIQSLIERAAHPETPIEEARTSALIAVRMIAKDKSLEKLAAFEASAAAFQEVEARERPRPEKPPDDGTYRVMRARFPGICRVCVGDIEIGDQVAHRKRWGTAHIGCMRKVGKVA